MKPVLKQGFGMSDEDSYDFLNSNEESIYEFSLSEMKNAVRHVNVTLLRKFNDQFKKDPQGKSRNWREIEEGEITEIYKTTKANVDSIIEEFKKIQFPRNVTAEPGEEETPESEGPITDQMMIMAGRKKTKT